MNPDLTHYFWAAGILVEFAICGAMLKNRSSENFPQFFRYCTFGAIQNLALLAVHTAGNYAVYFYAFYSTAIISAILALFAIQETFTSALKPLDGLRDLGRIAFRWAAALVFVLSILVAVRSHPTSSFFESLPRTASNLESSVRVTQVGLLLLLFAISKRIGLSVRSRTFGIALGMGLNASVNMFAFSIATEMSSNTLAVLNLVRSGMFLVIAITWLAYFALPAIKEKPFMVPIASPLMRWNEVAAAIGHPAGRVMYVNSPEPFLPQVERMVEEVMRRQNRVN